MRTQFIRGGIVLFLALCWFWTGLAGADQSETIYIRAGQFAPVDNSAPLPIVTFSRASSGPAVISQMVIFMTAGDQLHLTIVNQDAAPHEFKWTFDNTITRINAGDSAMVMLEPATPGAYPFVDNANYPFNIARGLSGAVVVKEPGDNAPDFVWFLNEHDAEWLTALASGQPIDSASYLSDYFTINGLSFPASEADTLATVRGQVNQPLNIWIVNGGLQAHSLHFHGYHVTLLNQNGAPFPAGYVKDTFPVKPGVGLQARLTPHQAGMFPVHDHALTAATAKGVYPNGMMAMLHIEGGK